MTYPTTFATLAAGNQPASLLDTMFNIVGGMGSIPCTATGTNAITLTPVTNYYQPASYQNFQMITWKMPASLTGSATVQLGPLGVVKLFMPSGVQANSGDLSINTKVIAMFAADLDGGNGGFLVFNATTPSVIQGVQGTVKALQTSITNDTQVTAVCDEIILENSLGGTIKLGPLAVTINTGASGANGIDSGAVATGTFYSVWFIHNSTTATTAGLLSTSSTTPTMPAGFTYRARVGWAVTAVGSTNLHRLSQKGRVAQFLVTPGSVTAALPVITSSFGSSASWQANDITKVCPSTASAINLQFVFNGSVISPGTATQWAAVAPNPNYSLTSPSTSPFAPLASFLSTDLTTAHVAVGENKTASFLREADFVYTAISGAPGAVLSALGWQDNI